MITLASWNVNGLRAADRKGFSDYVDSHNPDILCLQETKAQPDQLDDHLVNMPGYHSYFASAEKKGYSGVALYAKAQPLDVQTLNTPEFDREGRTLIAHFTDFSVITGYFPNSQAEGARLDYKLAYCDRVWQYADELISSGRDVVICGDYNIAHKPIDLARPKQNEKNPGYLPEEREWMTRFLAGGYVDTFRAFHQEPEQYSWWSYRGGARQRNVGWRLDYHTVNQRFRSRLLGAAIHADITGSDHCPVSVQIDGELS